MTNNGSIPSTASGLLDIRVVRQHGRLSGHDAASVREAYLEQQGLTRRASSAEEVFGALVFSRD
eukprot:CAMPEP_0175060026 /NCGR_PEP_ID=MMETSP0052_2-20121109/12763_1 /TAXON_ID=51329 ORGANISM="Polytomella parva, Strain SAG 63-3" /NCGR_SAMPLE_ID=MMETSP0052_2 /ASSEMBLY_ACC=CAM_ASM_000194 /LENGTH=63 /DNA_ID=CAMNT_0016325649 /DNA_START=305 /DNA_END=496 /DNA_ORIENTATION=-